KGFHLRRLHGRGGWVGKPGAVPCVPYRLPKLNAAPTDEPGCVIEGEKDADRLAALVFVATIAAGPTPWPWTSPTTPPPCAACPGAGAAGSGPGWRGPGAGRACCARGGWSGGRGRRGRWRRRGDGIPPPAYPNRCRLRPSRAPQSAQARYWSFISSPR